MWSVVGVFSNLKVWITQTLSKINKCSILAIVFLDFCTNHSTKEVEEMKGKMYGNVCQMREWESMKCSLQRWWLNTNQCYLQITYTRYTCTDVCTQQRWFLVNPPRCFPSLLYLSSFTWSKPFFYLLGDPASFARGANTHPLLSLVFYQMFSPCCFTHPKAPHRSSYIFT